MIPCNIFEEHGAKELVRRIHKLLPKTSAHWGQMTVEQMLSHCADAFVEHGKMPSRMTCLYIRLTRKQIVIGRKTYPKNLKTAKEFIQKGDKNFQLEKHRLIAGISAAQLKGHRHYQNKKHPVFGRITGDEWNTFFVKHIDHHLRQFGV